MRAKFLSGRRPSAAIVMSSVALFMSLGGVGYAAISLPAGSVGTAQLADSAVTNHKIANGVVGNAKLANYSVGLAQMRTNAVSYYNIVPGAIGIRRIATDQVQVRVGGSCAGGSAIGAISVSGGVTCNSALPSEVGTSDTTVAVPTSATGPVSVVSRALPGGAPYSQPAPVTYQVFANPTATVTSTSSPQHVSVSCTLGVGSSSETRVATVDTTGTAGTTSSASVPLQLAAGQGAVANVSCQSAVSGTGAAPGVSVTSAINALQTAGNS